jgi:hypothetical protein
MSTQYPIDVKTTEQIDRTFTSHTQFGDQKLRADVIRDRFKALAFLVASFTPPSREQSLAFTHLEEASFYSIAAIARNEKE